MALVYAILLLKLLDEGFYTFYVLASLYVIGDNGIQNCVAARSVVERCQLLEHVLNLVGTLIGLALFVCLLALGVSHVEQKERAVVGTAQLCHVAAKLGAVHKLPVVAYTLLGDGQLAGFFVHRGIFYERDVSQSFALG